jgi:hypothetical protein
VSDEGFDDAFDGMHDRRHDHGSLGEEAARLADAVQEWLRSAPGQRGRDVWATATSPSQDAAECRVCPVCQALRVLRSTRPETFEHLADAAASFAAALRGLVVDQSARPRQQGDTVEHIDLG